jgi:hypothetical protein
VCFHTPPKKHSKQEKKSGKDWGKTTVRQIHVDRSNEFEVWKVKVEIRERARDPGKDANALRPKPSLSVREQKRG